MNFILLTLFPEMFPATLQYSLAGKALKNDLWRYSTINIRDFGLGKHKQIDDTQYGGGNGLVMRCDILGKALDYIYNKFDIHLSLYPSARGFNFTNRYANNIIKDDNIQNILILCGRYEGIDQRVIEHYHFKEISMGDYILSGGEIAALTIMDAMIRLIPNVIINSNTIKEESFAEYGDNTVEYDLYTKPQVWNGRSVPEILLSGHHSQIKDWKKQNSRLRTMIKLNL